MKRYNASLVIAFLIIISTGAHARDIYVSPTGSGSSFTLSSPGSAQSGLQAAQPGDTVYFMDGVYKDTTNSWEYAFNYVQSGTSGNPITIKALNRQRAIVQRTSPWNPAIGIQGRNYVIIDGFKSEGMLQLHGCNYSIIRNCEVTKGSAQGNGSDVSLNWGINIQASNYCTVQNNYVHDMDDTGNHSHNTACIMVYGGSDYNTIEYNTVDGGGNNIYNAFGTKAGGMDDNIWRFNFGSNCTAGFIAMGNTGDSNYTRRNKIHNNVIINTDWFFESHHGSEDWQIYNNTFYNGTHFFNYGYYAQTSSVCPRNHYIWNNVAVAVSNIYRREQSSTPTWSLFNAYSDYNQAYNASRWGTWSGGYYGPLGTWVSSAGSDSHSITTNPGYLNAGGTSAADYKRSSYPANGRGGSYASVIGAYITGDETIGYTASGESPVTPPPPSPIDTTPPASPTGVTTTIIN